MAHESRKLRLSVGGLTTQCIKSVLIVKQMHAVQNGWGGADARRKELKNLQIPAECLW